MKERRKDREEALHPLVHPRACCMQVRTGQTQVRKAGRQAGNATIPVKCYNLAILLRDIGSVSVRNYVTMNIFVQFFLVSLATHLLQI